MAKGQISKETITKTLLSTFEGAFIAMDGKTIRVPMIEDGDTVEIKITLTAAKDLERGEIGAISGAAESVVQEAEPVEPTEKELSDVAEMMALLGM